MKFDFNFYYNLVLNSGDKVVLLVENTRFVVDPAVLIAKPDTMLGRMFTVRAQRQDGVELVRPNDQNEYEVADGLSASCFRAILVGFVIYWVFSFFQNRRCEYLFDNVSLLLPYF